MCVLTIRFFFLLQGTLFGAQRWIFSYAITKLIFMYMYIKATTQDKVHTGESSLSVGFRTQTPSHRFELVGGARISRVFPVLFPVYCCVALCLFRVNKGLLTYHRSQWRNVYLASILT
jgi:hypothetical protein